MYLEIRSEKGRNTFCHVEKNQVFWLFIVMFIARCPASEIAALWAMAGGLFRLSMLPITPLLDLWSSTWNGSSPKGNPAEPSTCCWKRICTPRNVWIFPIINYPQNNFTPNLHESLSVLKPSKGGDMCHYGERERRSGTKRAPLIHSDAHLFQGIWQSHANSNQRTNAKNNCPLKRLYIFMALMQNPPPCRVLHLLLFHLSQSSKTLICSL